MEKYSIAICIVMLSMLMSGCSGQQTRASSSVVEYLYPQQQNVVVEPATPVLNIPLKVGIAFVPEQHPHRRSFNIWAGVSKGVALTEGKKRELLDKVAEHFKAYEFVSDIEVIPSAYLTPGGSFANLDQIRTMYGVDVMALVSYDQVQFTDEGFLSITYWTLVGAYVFSGEKNDTSTMMDTVVYDIASRKMLFRAPGTSSVKGSSTPVNLSESLREDSLSSFEATTAEMIANLDREMDEFREKIKEQPGQVKIVERPGYSGGGGLGWWELLAWLISVCVIGVCRRCRAA